MIEPCDDAPPAPPRAPWLVRTFGPRPTVSVGGRIGEVLRRTAWFVLLEIVLIAVMRSTGIPVGNAGAEEIDALLSHGPLIFFAVCALILPATEELMFRGLPSLLSDLFLRRKGGRRWALGIVSTLAFAAVHNITGHADAGAIPLGFGRYFDTATVPATQFLFGLLLWDLVRRYGLWASALSHMFHNFVLLLPVLAFKGSS